jgi:hybrid cluster-associated redox disulfide protein
MTERDPPEAAVTADMTMAQALRADPNLPAILMRFHIGGCSMCGFEETDTVAQVADDNGIPVERLLAALNGR